MKTVSGELQCIEQIRKNMTAAGCSEAQITEAIGNYRELYKKGAVEIAVLA